MFIFRNLVQDKLFDINAAMVSPFWSLSTGLTAEERLETSQEWHFLQKNDIYLIYKICQMRVP